MCRHSRAVSLRDDLGEQSIMLEWEQQDWAVSAMR